MSFHESFFVKSLGRTTNKDFGAMTVSTELGKPSKALVVHCM